MVDANTAVRPAFALLPALGAMTSLQALVAFALFAPGVVAPRARLEVWQLSMFACAVFAVGIPASFWGGSFISRMGSLRISSLCAAIALSMALASLGSTAALLAAGLCLGLAFGPETPASAALLARLVTAERRAFVFSVRQTGNQIGARSAARWPCPRSQFSLGPTWCYVAVGVCALLTILLFERLRLAYATGKRIQELPLTPPRSARTFPQPEAGSLIASHCRSLDG